MQNPWLCVDSFDDEEDDGVFMGVFNRSPAEIAKHLNRPQTPSFGKIQMSYNKNEDFREEESVESPVIRGHSADLFCGNPFVAVF